LLKRVLVFVVGEDRYLVIKLGSKIIARAQREVDSSVEAPFHWQEAGFIVREKAKARPVDMVGRSSQPKIFIVDQGAEGKV